MIAKNSMFYTVKKCRICGSTDLKKYLNLGALPLANNLVPLDIEGIDPFFPLEVQLCNKCKLSQLTVVVDPKILFSEYAYFTSVSTTFQKHFAEMALVVEKYFQKTEDCLVADIASNDGCLLEQFKKRGFKIAGIEPAGNIAKIANEKGIPTIQEFWGEKAAKDLVEKFGKPDIVTATNVFAHVDDVHGFVKNVKSVLKPDGIFIIEFPHALNLIEKNEFDTIYHEHLSYFLVKPLIELFEIEKMEVFDIQKIAVHGGSIRVFVKFIENKKIGVQKERISEMQAEEEKKGLYGQEKYFEFANRAMDVKIGFLELMSKLKKVGKKIAGYGAAAKASTLLNYCGIGSDYIEFIADDAPSKQNKFFAGNRVPIYPSGKLEKSKPDYLVIFAWTIAEEIIKKTREKNFNGKYIIPMPFPKIIE